jgi:hypothetical protein
MANKVQVKRTSITGRQPNTTNSANGSYIAAGELALNLTDGILYSSNGNSIITVGANVVNLNITGGVRANGSFGTSTQVLSSNGNGVYWATPTGGGGASAYNYYNANIAIGVYSSNLIDTSSSNVYVTLPVPFQGAWVKVADGGGDKYTKPVIILRNGYTINGANEDLELDVPNVKVELVYTGTTWKVFAQ